MAPSRQQLQKVQLHDNIAGCDIFILRSELRVQDSQCLEFEKCFVSPMRLIFKTFCRGGWFIGDGGACLKLEKQPFMSCLFISLTAFNTEKLSETWNQWKGHPIFRAQPLVIR